MSNEDANQELGTSLLEQVQEELQSVIRKIVDTSAVSPDTRVSWAATLLRQVRVLASLRTASEAQPPSEVSVMGAVL